MFVSSKLLQHLSNTHLCKLIRYVDSRMVTHDCVPIGSDTNFHITETKKIKGYLKN